MVTAESGFKEDHALAARLGHRDAGRRKNSHAGTFHVLAEVQFELFALSLAVDLEQGQDSRFVDD